MENKKKLPSESFKPYKSYILLSLSIAATIAVAYFIFLEVQSLFKYSIRQRVLAVAQTAALNFNPLELDEIRGRQSVGTKIYKDTVLELQEIRLANPGVQFVDIYRRTEDPVLFEYVADADSMHPDSNIDLNGDGIIDEQDALNYPGDIYDGTDVPNFVENAFIKPDVDPELELSQWGLTLDASAPIFGHDSHTNYVFNVSMDVTEFVRHTNLAFIPFLVFVCLLIIILVFLTLSLVKMWGSRVEILKELDQQKDELLSIVSHQLATPVSSIKWYTEMLIDGDLGKVSKEQKEHLSSMTVIAQSLSDLVSMILDVSRIQLGRMRIEKQELDLQTFFKEILEIITPKASEKKQNFEVSIPKIFPKAMLDKRYTLMTIENLLSNAIKYTPESGTVKFKVEVRDSNLYCEVSDTGCGIPEADQEKIFGKLYRASNVRNNVDGNGFGLFVAKGAVESQGGKIWFESEEGKGTTFYVVLPLK